MTNITTDQIFHDVVLSITDAKGNKATVDGAPVWTSSDAAILTVTAAADGMTAVVETVGPGVAHIEVMADADLGSGVTTISGKSDDITVTIGASHMASMVKLDLGAPTDKPAAAPAAPTPAAPTV